MLVNQVTRRVSPVLKNLYISIRTIPKVIPVQTMSTESKIVEPNNNLVGVAQMRSTNDKNANLEQVKLLFQKAKSLNVKFLFLPECCDFVGENRQETLTLSECLSSSISPYADLARDNNMWVSLGGIHESILNSSSEKTEKIYNTHVLINSNGEIVKTYHKLHLFDVVTPEFRFRESDVVSNGDRIIAPVETPIGKLGMQICYDIRFAEPSTILRKLGAEVLSYPSAFAFTTGQAHWEVLLRARAIENQCYVVAPAQIGFHNSKRQSYGYAMIVDPWGKILACSEQRELDVITAHIDHNKLEKIRQNMPCFEHRRNDIYSLSAIETAELENVDRIFGSQTIPASTIFFESPYCYAFTNLRCVVKGHVLVSTKRVAPRLQDLNRDEISDLFNTVCKIQRMLEDIYHTSAATVTVQDGPDAGQTINHVHFHVMPRRPGDFGHNDQIYTQLEKICDSKNRDITEMVSEAEIYRDFIIKRRI
ncbi:nitrilase and fragile histidine triad fusion protein NitFhit [Episyrphus balteatus]|uniref:nitrilase and fragile histidine triad fusion protein NitFhit n=1 Tax=Episyrphus balteatus TaxID=286459 RepID=UPI002486B8C5|nr:nitrilase and fragile histidine triad fusion protein NitFhit [Episyrphus balteatus]